jgi:predicted dehydrogenase
VAERLRVAVIGLGSMGANHARVLAAMAEAELVAVCDVNEARLGAVAVAPGTAGYAGYRELLAGERLDAAVVAVPTRLHLEVALACIDRGLTLLVEKPLGADLEECLRLKAAAEQAGVPLMPGHIERFNPVVREVRRRVSEGDLGQVYQARAVRVGPFFERERDVGVVHDLATHDIDALRYVFAAEVESVRAEVLSGVRTPYEDLLVGMLRLDNGVIASLDVSWLAPAKVRALSLTGEGGALLGQLEARTLEVEREDGRETVDLRAAGEPLREELAAFLRVARGEPPPVTADDAIAAMRAVEALVESARTGESVRVTAGRPAR